MLWAIILYKKIDDNTEGTVFVEAAYVWVLSIKSVESDVESSGAITLVNDWDLANCKKQQIASACTQDMWHQRWVLERVSIMD